MDAEELSQHVDELELRLERLRVLYDQYFMGIEKVPPAVPQKDVDRRIWVLRREKIRNTGVRFKFQTIIQRYSTFHSYWMRIMREIENGTYKRHVQRAKRRFGEDPTAPPKVDAAREAPRSVELDDAHTFDVDLDLMDDDASLPSTGDDLGISTAPPPPASRPPAILSPLGTMRGPAPLPTAPAPASGAPTTGAPATAPARPPLPARSGTVAPSPAAPTTAVAAPARPAPPPSKPAPLPANPPPSPSNKGVTTTAPVVAAAVSSTAVTQPRAVTTEPKRSAPTASVPKILAAKVRNDDDLDAMLNEALGGPGGSPARPEPKLPSTTTQGVGPSRPGSSGSSGDAAPSAPKPAAPAVPASRPAARPAPVAPAPAASAVAGGGGDFRQVYAKYVEARRNNGESTAGLTYESLAKNLRDTTEKLKTKSGGKPIDFDVVVKDGKTILKPVVK